VDSREAKEILALYRPGSTDAADPRMAEALDHARRDPELGAWFEQQSAVNAAIRAKLKAIPVPAALKREIIVGRAEHDRIIPLPPAIKILAAAAAVALLVTIGWHSFRTEPDPYVFTNYRDRMARTLQKGVPYMNVNSTNEADVLRYCQIHGSPTNFVLPAKLQELPVEGGSALTWNNQAVSMLCLNAGVAGARNDVWVFVMDRSALPDPPPVKPAYLLVGNLMTASWSAGGKVYLLAGAGTEKDVEKFFTD